VQRAPVELLRRNVVVNDHQQIVITILACAATCTSIQTEINRRGLKCSATDRSRSSRDFAGRHLRTIAVWPIVRDCEMVMAPAPWRGCRKPASSTQRRLSGTAIVEEQPAAHIRDWRTGLTICRACRPSAGRPPTKAPPAQAVPARPSRAWSTSQAKPLRSRSERRARG